MLKEIFNRNKDIIINSDIDGFLSGMILQKYFGCKVVGFSNSWDCVWIDNNYEKSHINALDTPVYVDLYVTNPDVVCIEQHIIGYNEAHNKRISAYNTKINPNLMRNGRSFTGDYFHKYPFGTVHFLIALMEEEGINVNLPNLMSSPSEKLKKYSLTVGDIILRADDALFSSLGKYKANTEEWWPWLLSKSNNSQSIESMIKYIDSSNPKMNFQVKDRTGYYFTKEFNCSGIDGEFKNVTDNNGRIFEYILDYQKEISLIMNMPLDLPTNYVIHRGNASTKQYKGTGIDLDFNADSSLYSYAFIYGPRSPKHNFSYTTDMK